ncbi:unnamed protein product [Amoebophrya sp. A25]|nr:unnamed protein product [Amoebophrya sp. A25]|eukprot:GSA25T00000527001.1
MPCNKRARKASKSPRRNMKSSKKAKSINKRTAQKKDRVWFDYVGERKNAIRRIHICKPEALGGRRGDMFLHDRRSGSRGPVRGIPIITSEVSKLKYIKAHRTSFSSTYFFFVAVSIGVT